MLTIRKQQLDHFDEDAWEAFRRRLATFLRTEMAEETEHLDDDQLYAFVVSCEQRAKGYGIETEQGFALFTSLSVEMNQFIDDLPEIKKELAQSPDPEQLLGLLVDVLSMLE